MSLVKQLPPLDLKALLVPFGEQQPAGVFDEEDELFQNVDQEMVKLGGLQERTIDWNIVDEGARRYLSNKCKHFRMAGHLITVRARTKSWRGWSEAAGVLSGMVERYWETGYPKPGTSGFSNKRRLVSQYLERLSDALPSLDKKGYAESFYKEGQQAFDSLQAKAEYAGLNVAELSKLEAKLRQYAELNQAPEPVGKPAESSEKNTALADSFFASMQVNSGNEREGRRSLLSAAEIINQQDAYDSTGYLLRRFALWAHLTQAPSPRKGRQTELMAVPADTADDYNIALTNGTVDPELLQRVERSVASSPYWLRGSFLSAGIARKLDMPQVAEAIRQAAERFVTRLPALATLEFMDGRPFVDQETQTWLSGAEKDANAGTSTSGLEYSAVRDELRVLLESGGVESLLRGLEQLQKRKTDLRHNCHVMAIAAELLASRGLDWLAEGLYVRAHNVMDSASARAWEPELYELLARHVPIIAKRKD